jgi:sodium/potassium/calcium exchanger 6
VSAARDGFAPMAITACFASPLFTMLGGASFALSAGALRQHGSLAITLDLPLKLMYGFTLVNMAKFAVIVPWYFKGRLTRATARIALGFYALYQVAYVYVVNRTEADPQ